VSVIPITSIILTATAIRTTTFMIGGLVFNFCTLYVFSLK
jgi:hypothetical protein